MTLDDALDGVLSREPPRVGDGWASIHPVIRSIVAMNLRSRDLGPLMVFEDICADVTLQILERDRLAKWPEMRRRGYSGFQFIARIARLAFIDVVRKHNGRLGHRDRVRGGWDAHFHEPHPGGRGTLAAVIADRRIDPESDVIAADMQRRALACLAPRQREAMVAMMGGVSITEMAAERGITKGAVCHAIAAGRERIAQELAA